MATPEFLDPRLTERRNPRTTAIDVASSLEIFDLLNAEDETVAVAVRREREAIAKAIDLVVGGFRRGGRLIYVGAGTSGRLGVLVRLLWRLLRSGSMAEEGRDGHYHRRCTD